MYVLLGYWNINYNKYNVIYLLEASVEAAEKWVWRKITRTSWTKRKTIVEVLTEFKEERKQLNKMETRKIKFIGHISHQYI